MLKFKVNVLKIVLYLVFRGPSTCPSESTEAGDMMVLQVYKARGCHFQQVFQSRHHMILLMDAWKKLWLDEEGLESRHTTRTSLDRYVGFDDIISRLP